MKKFGCWYRPVDNGGIEIALNREQRESALATLKHLNNEVAPLDSEHASVMEVLIAALDLRYESNI